MSNNTPDRTQLIASIVLQAISHAWENGYNTGGDCEQRGIHMHSVEGEAFISKKHDEHITLNVARVMDRLTRLIQ